LWIAAIHDRGPADRAIPSAMRGGNLLPIGN
jgi:hypothetical protein